MNFLKRAFLSLKHKAVNNILLIVLFTVLATLILCGLSIREASISSCTAIRRALGGSVQVTNEAASKGVAIKDAKKMASIKYVKSSNFTYYLSAYGADFKAVGSNVKGNKSDDIDAYGISNLNALTAFKNKTKQISEGRALTEKDVGTNNAVISKKLAEYNKLKIGNKITLGNLKSGKETSFSIVGIYDFNESMNEYGTDDINTVYCPYIAANELSGNNIVYTAKYELDDAVNINAFKSEASKIISDKYNLYAQDTEYERLAGPISSITTIADILFFISAIASAAILFLIVLLTFKSRNFEIGILLSTGEKKIKIAAQMAVEILIPILIAFGISAALGNISTRQAGNVLSNIQNSVVDDYQNSSSETSDTEEGVIADSNDTDEVSQINVSLDTTVTGNQYLTLFLLEIIISLLAAMVPIVTIMQFSPKKILSQLE